MSQLSKIAVGSTLALAAAWAPAAAQTPPPPPFAPSAPSAAAPPTPASQPAAKLVSVKADNIPLSQALAQLQAQTGQAFSSNPQANVTADFEGVPLWDAVRGLLEAAGQKQTLNLQTGPANGQRMSLTGRWFTHGPFVVVASAIRHEADFRRDDHSQEKIWLELQVAGDPATPLAYMDSTATPSKAVADNGASLMPPPAPSPQAPQLLISRVAVRSVRLSLQPPESSAAPYPQSIKLLEGVIPGAVVAKTQAIEVPILESLDKDLDGATVSIKCTPLPVTPQPVTPQPPNQQPGSMYTLEIKFAAMDGMSTDDWKLWSRRIPAVVAQLRDGAGKETILSINSYSSSSRYYTMRGQIKAPASTDGAKFVIEVPTELQDVLVPYHFEDLPLP